MFISAVIIANLLAILVIALGVKLDIEFKKLEKTITVKKPITPEIYWVDGPTDENEEEIKNE